MRVEYHSDFIDVELEEEVAFSTVSSSSYIQIIPDYNVYNLDVAVNGQYIDADNYAHIPIGEMANIAICANGKTQNYEVKPVAKRLLTEFSDPYGEFNFQYLNISKSSPVAAILSGKLKMYAVEKSAEVEDITKILEKIEAAYPAFKRICEKPKSHLRAINEVRPIETVKRVGYESISYLAAHSEDWLAKTASGLKPARLFSRVEDDEYQIYENRVVITLVDLICSFLKRSCADLNYTINQIKGIISSQVQTNSFGFDAGFQKAVSELIPSDNAGDGCRSKQFDLAIRLLAQATTQVKKYRTLNHSILQKYLRRTKRVTNPLNETNILLMDKDYSVVYKLWRDIHKVIIPRELDKAKSDGDAVQENSYKLFCRVLCEYVAHTMKFEQVEEEVYLRKADNIQIAVKEDQGKIIVIIMDAKKRELKIDRPLVCPINDGEIWGKFEYRSQTLYWSNDTTSAEIEEFCALLKTIKIRDIRGKKQEKSEEQARYVALKSELEKQQRYYGVPKSYKIVILPTFCDVEDETRNQFSEHMKSIADSIFSKNADANYVVIAMPKCQSNEQKLTAYAKQHGEKIAFMPLTMFDINSYRRLQGLFLRIIIEIGNGKCPYCGSNMRGSGSRYECEANDCKLVVTDTACDNQSCKHKFTYLSYIVRQEVLDNMRNIDQNDFFTNDSIFQYKDIIQLSVGNKISPICPKCGQ